MIVSRRVALDGHQLDEVDSRIVIQSIESQAGRDNVSAVSYGGNRHGQRVTQQRRDYLEIQVRFAINIKSTDLEGRAYVLERVIRWARGGGKLTVSYRPGRFARVILTQAPGEGDIRAWTNEYTLTFRAYGIPYWQDTDAAALNSGPWLPAASMEVSLDVPGNARAYPEYWLTNMSGAEIKTVTIGIKSLRKFSFDNLGLMAGEMLCITHDDNDVLQIQIRGTDGEYRSAMAARTTASDDDLYAGPGSKVFYYTAQRACSLSIRIRGRYQ